MSQKAPSLKLNMVMNTLNRGSEVLFALLTYPYISRALLPDATGKVSFATSVVTYFSILAQLGIPIYGIRAVAKVRDNKTELSRTVHEILTINLCTCITVCILFAISLFAVPRFAEDRILYAVMGISIILNALGVEWLYQGLEKYTYITVRALIFRLIAVIAMVLLVHSPEDYRIYGALSVFAVSASNVLNFINLRKHIILKPVGSYNFRKHLPMVMVFFSMSVATTIYTNLDKVMLGFMTTDTQVGYYEMAVVVRKALVVFITSTGAVLLPRASYYIEKGLNAEFKKLISNMLKFATLASLAACIFFILFARPIVVLVFGQAFEGSVLPLKILMPAVVLVSITNVLGIQMMIPLGMEKTVLHSEVCGAVIDFVLNLVFIPSFGAAGAAASTLIAEVAVLIWQVCVIKKEKCFEK